MFDLVNSFLGSLDAYVFGARATPIVAVRKNVRFNKKNDAAVYHCPSIHHLRLDIKRQADFPRTGDGYVVLVRWLEEFVAAERKEKLRNDAEYLLQTACLTAIWQKAQDMQMEKCPGRNNSAETRDFLLIPDLELLDILKPFLPSDDLSEAEAAITASYPKSEKNWTRYGVRLLQETGGDRSKARWQLARAREMELISALALLVPTGEQIGTFVRACSKTLFSKATPPSS